jgi:hypothetical protein
MSEDDICVQPDPLTMDCTETLRLPGVGLGVAVGAGVAVAVGSGVGPGVAVGSTVGIAVGSGDGAAVGTGASVAVGSGTNVAVGSGGGARVAVGSGSGVAARASLESPGSIGMMAKRSRAVTRSVRRIASGVRMVVLNGRV